jgi:hypothetical protein
MIRRARRAGCRASRLRRRYGCFRLPRVPGAKSVKESARKDVVWLARTDPARKEVEFSEAFDRLSPDAKRYIVLHERAHLETGSDHNDLFYQALKRLVVANRIPWKIAYELESFNCHAKH